VGKKLKEYSLVSWFLVKLDGLSLIFTVVESHKSFKTENDSPILSSSSYRRLSLITLSPG
jgi:hypothetical protein